MNYGWTPEQQALRKEIHRFLAVNLTPEVRHEIEFGPQRRRDGNGKNGNRGKRGQGGGRRGPLVNELYQKIAENGWLGISWPKKYGGQDRDRMTQYIVEEEFARVGIGAGASGSGAPAVLMAGTEEQKDYFIPRIIRGEISFALGFTEPRGGADLANLQCRAVRDGDFYVINGQKTFTSGAHTATHMYLMARTDRDASPPHKGISIFLFPMDTPGITVRPIWTIQNDPRAPAGTTYGTARINETFFEDVRVPRTALLGEENMGWYVGAMGLNLDRVGASRYLRSINMDELVINWAKENTLGGYFLTEEPALRDKLAEMWIDAQVCRLMTMRSMSIVEYRDGNFTYEGSAEKVWAPEHGMKSTETIAQMLGPFAQLLNGSPGNIQNGVFAHNMLSAWVSGNNHGSTHIMRDQVARRGLGLPVRRN